MSLRNIQRLACADMFRRPYGRKYARSRGDPDPVGKMQEAVGKLNKAPATIGQSLQGLRDAAAAKLKQTLGAGAKPDAKAAPVDLDLPQKAAEIPAGASALKENGRDPFRPMTLRSKVTSRQRENLSPLERFELGQLKIVGIVWDIKETAGDDRGHGRARLRRKNRDSDWEQRWQSEDDPPRSDCYRRKLHGCLRWTKKT